MVHLSTQDTETHPSITAPSHRDCGSEFRLTRTLRTLNTPHILCPLRLLWFRSLMSLWQSLNCSIWLVEHCWGAGPSVQGWIISLWSWCCLSGLPLFCTRGTNQVSGRHRALTDPGVSGWHWRSDAAFRWSWDNLRLWSGHFYPSKMWQKSNQNFSSNFSFVSFVEKPLVSAF